MIQIINKKGHTRNKNQRINKVKGLKTVFAYTMDTNNGLVKAKAGRGQRREGAEGGERGYLHEHLKIVIKQRIKSLCESGWPTALIKDVISQKGMAWLWAELCHPKVHMLKP